MIRQASKKDIREIVKVDKEAFGEGGITEKMANSQLTVFPSGALVAVKDGRIIGVAFCERHVKRLFPPYIHNVKNTHSKNGKLFFLSVITVSETSRGKGIGTMLLKTVNQLAKKSGATKIYCPVNKKHPYLKKGVLKFWKKNGYRVVGETKWEVSPSRFLESYIFEKVI